MVLDQKNAAKYGNDLCCELERLKAGYGVLFPKDSQLARDRAKEQADKELVRAQEIAAAEEWARQIV